ncbi:MAG: UDP-GlcNAc:undecaprenyl-phosphate/decaprenyl-phosphate GlcNAc-phosphate transferase [Tepidanaerobacteraceae bacterium]|nr:UDP-GlcNAc:undecaprenyl-phosphate/decaprenyl-phosphate GlcNAc-phosphate transferase [Tepidanaerobacteraceae bacterium]
MLKTSFAVFVFIFSVLAGYYSTPLFIDVFAKGQAVAKNFRGQDVPQGIGIMFAFYTLLWYAVFLPVTNLHSMHETSFEMLIVMTAFFVVGFTGFIDDMLGSRDTLGFSGHFGALLSGRLTTGALKALAGLLAAFTASYFLSYGASEIILNTLIIALFTNLLNLLDLRPGRAIKFYIIIMAFYAISAAVSGDLAIFFIFLPLIGSVIGYFPFDLKARCMMGDAGSNVLGVSAGILTALHFDLPEKIAVLLILIAIHIFAEKYSLSDIIARNRVLRFIDELGR